MSYPYYILIGKRVFKTDREGYLKWEMKYPGRRCVAFTRISPTVEVSTIFLMIDYRMRSMGEGKPIVFETLIFKHDKVVDGQRYCTYNEALKGHEEMVKLARDQLVKENKN